MNSSMFTSRRLSNDKSGEKQSTLLPSQVQRAISSRPVLVTQRECSVLASAKLGKRGRGKLDVLKINCQSLFKSANKGR